MSRCCSICMWKPDQLKIKAKLFSAAPNSLLPKIKQLSFLISKFMTLWQWVFLQESRHMLGSLLRSKRTKLILNCGFLVDFRKLLDVWVCSFEQSCIFCMKSLRRANWKPGVMCLGVKAPGSSLTSQFPFYLGGNKDRSDLCLPLCQRQESHFLALLQFTRLLMVITFLWNTSTELPFQINGREVVRSE